MARLKLHKSTVNGDYEVYPVYELDYAQMSNLDGFGMDETSDTLTNKNYKARKFHCQNARLLDVVDGNIPLLENAEGNIIPFWHRFRTQMMVNGHNCWVLDQENRESYAAIQQGVQPPDWGVNPNYVTLFQDYFTMDGNSSTWFDFPRAVYIDEAFSSSKSYYEDTKRSELRMFYTETGTSFSAWKMSISRGAANTLYARQYGFAKYPRYPSGSGTKAHYNYTLDDNTLFGDDFGFKYECGITSNYQTLSYVQSGASFHDGANCPMVFVHFTENGTDFYGVALIQLSSFTGDKDTCVPEAVVVSAIDTTFWGKSVISGGGGAGSWTNDGPISYIQGGTGKFDAPSDNRGDQTGTTVINIVSQWGANYSALCASGYHKYNLGFDSTAGVDDSAAFEQFMSNLWNPGIFTRFTNFVMNPIDSILSCHLIPKKLSPPFATSDAGKDNIVAANVELTPDHTVSKFHDLVNTYHLGSVDIENFSDSFADYTNTAIYIHLPYIGTKQIDVNACMGGWISVDYAVEYLTGDCIAFITTCDKEGHKFLRYSFKGNCAKAIPVKQTGGNLVGAAFTAATIAGTAALATAKAGAAAAGAIIPAIATPLREGVPLGTTIKETIGQLSELEIGSSVATATKGLAAGIATSSLSSLISSSQITSSNAEGGSVSAPCDTVCYIVIQRPMWSAPEEYGKQFGYPSDIGGTINQSNTETGDAFTNFLAVRSIKLDGVNATDEEKSEIEALMTAGVYVSND